MLKIRFEQTDEFPDSFFEPYDATTRIPFSLRLVKHPGSSHWFSFRDEEPGSRKAVNEKLSTYTLRVMIEFRFNRESHRLNSIHLVSALDKYLKFIPSIDVVDCDRTPYACFVDDYDKLATFVGDRYYLAIDSRIQVSYNETCIAIDFGPAASIVKHHLIARNCAIGVSNGTFLCSVIIFDLTRPDIKNIFNL